MSTFFVECGLSCMLRGFRAEVISFVVVTLCALPVPAQPPFADDRLELSPGDSATFVYTNKQSAFYYGEAGSGNRVAFHGLNVLTQEYLEDYLLLVDGQALDRRRSRVEIYPDRLVRRYAEAGVVEEVRLLDSLSVLAVKVKLSSRGQVAFLPAFSGSRQPEDFVQRRLPGDSAFAVALRSRLSPQAGVNYPAWAAVAAEPRARLAAAVLPPSVQPAAPAAGKPTATGFADLFAGPCLVPMSFTVTGSDSVLFFVMVGNSDEEIVRLQRSLRKDYALLASRRQQRMQQLLTHSAFASNLPEFDRAVRWAKVSLDALIMNQQGKGIFAGLPWFNNYWGRDTFISLPGATLVTGNYAEAREILLSFGRFQLRDPAEARDGRIPNRVMPGEIIYNTADGTPWFILAAWDYYRYSGDESFAAEMLPVAGYAVTAALAHTVDSLGFFTHADADTWMDAVGPQGPWSPRGNRAVEIQVLWYAALQRTAEVADKHGEIELARTCRAAAERLRRQFAALYWDAQHRRLFDHLNVDGSPDLQLRPNQIFAVAVPAAPLLALEQAALVTAEVVQQLTYPYGVASLSQHDNNFHPYHHYAPYYVQDAAYHNGIVWTWLSGPVNTALCRFGRQDLAFQLLQSAGEQILTRGCRGTQSELLDALARPGENFPRLSGTVSQAWNLAEFLRNLYQDILGVTIDAPANTLRLQPRLPETLTSVNFKVWVGKQAVVIAYARNGGHFTVELQPGPAAASLSFEIFDAASATVGRGQLRAQEKVGLTFSRAERKLVSSSANIATQARIDSAYRHPLLAEVAFAQPHLRPDLPALRGPSWPLLNSAQAVQPFPARSVISLTDAAGDDREPNGRYQYPRNPAFAAGMFDLRRIEVAQQDSLVHFRLQFTRLVQPGWHPEYGYQLTFAALAIDTDRDAATGTRAVGSNSNQTLPEDFGADRLVYLGGGALVHDAAGRTLLHFVPDDPARTPGNVENATITVALPLRFFGGAVEKWRFAVYTGGQDDHGGAGVGEFRAVLPQAGEWHGGGGEHASGNCNVYDSAVSR